MRGAARLVMLVRSSSHLSLLRFSSSFLLLLTDASLLPAAGQSRLWNPTFRFNRRAREREEASVPAVLAVVLAGFCAGERHSPVVRLCVRHIQIRV